MATQSLSSREQCRAGKHCAGALLADGQLVSLPRQLSPPSAGRGAEQSFFGALALLFAVSSAITIALCRSMSGGMAMPGGWTMSMAWMQMPGQTFAGAAAAFLGMWVVMMVAMMLPSLTPMLNRYRETGATIPRWRLDWLTTLVGTAYFAVWAACGLVVFPAGFGLSMAEMQNAELSRAVPIAAGVLVLFVGFLQLTTWKARRLACCAETPSTNLVLPASAASAWRYGLRLGLHCGSCCFGLMLIMVVLGVMDLRLMTGVTAAITVERLAPNGVQVARAIGWVGIAAGVFLIARAFGIS